MDYIYFLVPSDVKFFILLFYPIFYILKHIHLFFLQASVEVFFLSCSFINPDTTVRRHKTLQHPLFLSMIFINCISHLSEKIALSHRCTICTWCPFIFRRPICGAHGILLGLHPRLGRSPISARGSDKQKNPPLVSPSLKSFFLPLFFSTSLSFWSSNRA